MGSTRVADQGGQSLIETSLALPLLLLLLLGLVDGARAYYAASSTANAAREGANYAARNATATRAQVAQRVCDATGLAAFGAACPTTLHVSCSATSDDVFVEVVHDFSLLTASVVNAAFKINPLPIRAAVRFPILTGSPPCAS
jgi:Flp pilus assembly protein TadG